MTEPRPSRYAIEKYLAGTATEDERSAIEASSSARAEVQVAQDEAAKFLAAHPSPQALRRAAESPSRRRWILGLAIAASLAGTAVLVVSTPPSPPVQPTERLKGGSTAWLDVIRDGTRTPISRVELRPSDVLSLRYTSRKPYIAVLLAEESGRVQVLSADRGQSRRVPIGQDVTLDEAFVLDEYRGRELFVVIFSDAALPLAPIESSIGAALAKGDGFGAIIESLENFGDAVSFRLERGP